MCTAQGLVNTCPWETSPLRKGKDISIDGNKVTKTAQSWASGTAIVSDGVILKHGSSVKQRWSFTIQNGTQQTIGVVTSAYDARSDEYVNKTTKGWGFYQSNGNKGNGGPANTSYASKFNVGDTVDGVCAHILVFDMWHGVLSLHPRHDALCRWSRLICHKLCVLNSASVFGHSPDAILCERC